MSVHWLWCKFYKVKVVRFSKVRVNREFGKGVGTGVRS